MCGGDGITHKFTPNVGRCIKCNGSGEIELTNEEWLCSIPTEEKANFLVMVEMLGMSALKRSTVDIEKFTEEVIAWLKQPYKGGKE